MNKIIALALSLTFFSSCLWFWSPSANPSRTFQKSLDKKDGNWQLSRVHIKAYTSDPLVTGEAPFTDTVLLNTGIFHFDKYDGDIDGTGTFTRTDGTQFPFTFKVPEFEEDEKTTPEVDILFSGYPMLNSDGNDYRKADSYTLTGYMEGDMQQAPFALLYDTTYKRFDVIIDIDRE